jgi:hypothetical protein
MQAKNSQAWAPLSRHCWQNNILTGQPLIAFKCRKAYLKIVILMSPLQFLLFSRYLARRI